MADRLHINVKKHYGDFTLNVTETINLKGMTALFGPSGSGKSTLLRLIAGFETPDFGEIKFNDIVWACPRSRLSPHKRPIGFMFQNGELFSHLTVKENLVYADRRNDMAGPTLQDVIEQFDLPALLGRKTHALSGGERQRIALARTVLRRPKLLLLDEPLAALDHKRKREILPFLKRLPLDFDIPCLYVSHDIEDVSQIADQMILITQGRITDTGAALDILESLNTDTAQSLQVERAIGSVFDARFKGYDDIYGLSTLSLNGSDLAVPIKLTGPINSLHRMRIAAKDVSLSLYPPQNLSIRNSLPVRIETITANLESPFAVLSLRLKSATNDMPLLRARITRASVMDLNLNTGQSVFALVKSVSFAKTLL